MIWINHASQRRWKKGISILLVGMILFQMPSFVFADFEDFGANARSVALGGAMTGLAESAQTMLINPAGLGLLRRAEIGTDYGRLFMGLDDNSDISISHVLIGIPISRRIEIETAEPLVPPETLREKVEAAAGEAAMEGIKEPSDNPQEPGTKVDLLNGKRFETRYSKYGTLGILYRRFALSGAMSESTMGLSWGGKIRRRLVLGLSAKSLSQKFEQDEYTRIDPVFNYGGSGSVSAMSFDFGALFNIKPNTYLGASILDLNEPDVSLKSGGKLPRTMRLGLGYKTNRFNAGADYIKKDDQWMVGTGGERILKRSGIALRLGYQFGAENISNVSVGFGSQFRFANLDYAFLFPLDSVDGAQGSHRVSLVFTFGTPIPDEADPGSLEQAYLEARERLRLLETELEEVRENRDSLEKVLVEESTLRIQERIESAKELARSRALALKNQSDATKRPTRPKVEVRTHRVKKGETLQDIAEIYYGSRAKWRVIYEENKNLVGRGGAIKRGQLLIIPPDNIPAVSSGQPPKSKFSSETAEPEKPKRSKWDRPETEAPAAPVTKPVQRHTVADGETLQSLAQKYYGNPADWKKIYSANKDKIIRGVPKVGATLVIPVNE